MVRDCELMENLIRRAKNANCLVSALITDLQVLGQRRKDIKNGLSALPKPIIANLIDLATKPEWCMKVLNMKCRTFRNTAGRAKNVGDLSSPSLWISEQFDPCLNRDDMMRIKDLWGGKLVIKGIVELEDAEEAAKSSADALVVSNHGDRQLNDTVSTVKTLPDVVGAVGSDIEVWMDNGIHNGQDILKVWALGAKGTMTGRVSLYGLGAYGKESVTRALETLYKEAGTSTAFTGHRNIQDVNSSILRFMRWIQDEF